MGCLLRLFALIVVVAALCGVVPPAAAQGARPALERGTAITDPLALRELDRGRFGLARMLAPPRTVAASLNDDELFALPPMAVIRKTLDAEFERYVRRHAADHPDETIGVGAASDFQLFDRALLYSPATRFVLSGIINRMDRAYVANENCGEIRLIYRLTQPDAPPLGDHAVTSRLPMTLNLVLKAKGDHIADGKRTVPSCAELARRWLASGDWPLTGAALAERLVSENGPLHSVGPENIDRLETNLQIAHALKSQNRDFRSDYLLKVFDYDAQAKIFTEATLENQFDSERIRADDNLRRAFKAWLLEPAHFVELDRGTVLIPKEFLATRAIVPTPAGFSNSDLQPAFGLMQGEGADPLFTEGDVVAALEKAARHGVSSQNIHSVAGFERRLNDITCAGCHQTRGIGGFHFPGVDWMAAKPSNSTVVPGSPHFFGDQVRRRDILISMRDGEWVDYSRGFSARPQLRGSRELAGTEYEDGWGAPCYGRNVNAAAADRSFKSWTCAKGLACQVMSDATRMGMCFVAGH
jgi:hypothetical protein